MPLKVQEDLLMNDALIGHSQHVHRSVLHSHTMSEGLAPFLVLEAAVLQGWDTDSSLSPP